MLSLTPLPPPLDVPWTMKPLSSAATALQVLDDGRLHLSIRHDVIHGVTPDMLLWWFQHLEGDMDVEGNRYPRYRVWHPRDHVAFAYAKRAPDGGIGPGAVFHIHEVFGRDPRWNLDVKTLVTRLDDGGFAHVPRLHGLSLARMDYTFRRVAGGTLYENSLTVGFDWPRARAVARLLNARIRRKVFPDERGRAWLLHNVEEVGNFEFFLPALYSSAQTSQGPRGV